MTGVTVDRTGQVRRWFVRWLRANSMHLRAVPRMSQLLLLQPGRTTARCAVVVDLSGYKGWHLSVGSRLFLVPSSAKQLFPFVIFT